MLRSNKSCRVVSPPHAKRPAQRGPTTGEPHKLLVVVVALFQEKMGKPLKKNNPYNMNIIGYDGDCLTMIIESPMIDQWHKFLSPTSMRIQCNVGQHRLLMLSKFNKHCVSVFSGLESTLFHINQLTTYPLVY